MKPKKNIYGAHPLLGRKISFPQKIMYVLNLCRSLSMSNGYLEGLRFTSDLKINLVLSSGPLCRALGAGEEMRMWHSHKTR